MLAILFKQTIIQPLEDVGRGSETQLRVDGYLKVINHPLYSMNEFVTNKLKLPKMGHKCFFIWDD